MNNCTKFAPLWMKFSNIFKPPDWPQATDPPLHWKIWVHLYGFNSEKIHACVVIENTKVWKFAMGTR